MIHRFLSIFLVWALPIMIIMLAGWTFVDPYRMLRYVKDFKKNSLHFKKYEYTSDADGTGGATIYAVGKLANSYNRTEVLIGSVDSFSSKFRNPKLATLHQGDTISVWYSSKYNYAYYRPDGEELNDLSKKLWINYITVYALSISLIIAILWYYNHHKNTPLSPPINEDS